MFCQYLQGVEAELLGLSLPSGSSGTRVKTVKISVTLAALLNG